MKTIILAGGKGSRLSEYTYRIPKPMVTIGDIPIIEHILNYFSYFDFNNFYIALGYKSEMIKKYFLEYNAYKSDLKIDFGKNTTEFYNLKPKNWTVSLVETGLNTMTGGRIKKLKKFINNETFLCTYGDGLCDVDLNQLVNFHKSHNKMVTVTAVKPPSRFGELDLNKNNSVLSFKEKPELSDGWINAGYFVMNPEIFDFISDDSTILEEYPLEHIASLGELKAFKHSGFWQCLDNSRDKEYLETIFEKSKAPWIK